MNTAGAAGRSRSRVPAWATDLLAGALVVVAPFVPNPDAGLGWGGAPKTPVMLALTVATAVAVALMLPLRRRYPLTVLAICVGFAVLAPLWTSSTSGFVLAAALGLHRVALVTSRRIMLAGLAVSIALLVGTAAITAALNGSGGAQFGSAIGLAAPLAVAAAIGDASRSRRAYIDAITERALRAERTKELEAERRVTEERLRIARELHDAAAHQIAAINLHAGVASSALPDRPEDAQRALEVIRASARSVLSEISALLRVLRATPREDGFPIADPVVGLPALDSLLDEFRLSGLNVDVTVDGDIRQVQGAVSVVAYKVIQEGLANALKHGVDQNARVTVTVRDPSITVRIVNEVAFVPSAADDVSGHNGLIGVRERVASVRGTADAGESGGRYTLTASLPFAPAGPATSGSRS